MDSGEKYCVETVYGKTVGMLVSMVGLEHLIAKTDMFMQGYGHVGPASSQSRRVTLTSKQN